MGSVAVRRKAAYAKPIALIHLLIFFYLHHLILQSLTERGLAYDRCHEILASGGLQSLLTLFETSHQSIELMLVSALTVVYLFPSLLDSEAQLPSHFQLGVIDCLQFLIRSSSTSVDIDISLSEIRTAAAFAMTNLWFKALVPKLRSSDRALATVMNKRFAANNNDQDPSSSKRLYRRRRASLATEAEEEIDCTVLIDAFTSLSITAAVSEASRRYSEENGQTKDMNVYYEFALIVESVCTVEYARPLALKEGVLQLLLQWLRSGDVELERPAANALKNLTLTKDGYLSGWVHSQLLFENALGRIVERLQSSDSGVRLAMAEIISSLTVAPHTRAGIIEARGVKYLVQVLGSVETQSSDDALALAAGNALLCLAMSASEGSRFTPLPILSKTHTSSKEDCIIG